MYEEKEIKYKKRKVTKSKETKKKTKKKNVNFEKLSKIKIKLPTFSENIKWKEIIIKLSVLILVMLLITFIISRINKSNIENSKVLDSNINNIKNAMINFYNPSNLPHNIGDSNSLILDELIEKEVIKEIKDSKNKSCDSLNSYVIITKTDDIDYRLKIYLSCKKEEKTKEYDLICFDTCQIKK